MCAPKTSGAAFSSHPTPLRPSLSPPSVVPGAIPKDTPPSLALGEDEEGEGRSACQSAPVSSSTYETFTARLHKEVSVAFLTLERALTYLLKSMNDVLRIFSTRIACVAMPSTIPAARRASQFLRPSSRHVSLLTFPLERIVGMRRRAARHDGKDEVARCFKDSLARRLDPEKAGSHVRLLVDRENNFLRNAHAVGRPHSHLLRGLEELDKETEDCPGSRLTVANEDHAEGRDACGRRERLTSTLVHAPGSFRNPGRREL